jgi:Ankyrin repeats (3 copies)
MKHRYMMNSLIAKAVMVVIACLLHLACWGSSVATAQSPFDAANVEDDNSYKSYTEVWRNATVEQVKVWLETKPDLEAKAFFSNTALIAASGVSTPDIVKLLLEAGADINAQNKDGETALMLATEKRDSEVIKLLRKAGAE